MTLFQKILKCIYSIRLFIYHQIKYINNNPSCRSVFCQKYPFCIVKKKKKLIQLITQPIPRVHPTHWNTQTPLSCTNTFLPSSLSQNILWRSQRNELFIAFNRYINFNACHFKNCVFVWALHLHVMAVSCICKSSTFLQIQQNSPNSWFCHKLLMGNRDQMSERMRRMLLEIQPLIYYLDKIFRHGSP